MKEQNEIDQLFEQQLGNLSVEPTAASWDKITSSLDAAAISGGGASGAGILGRKKLFIYALIGTVAAILAYVIFFNNQGKGRNIIPRVHPVVKIKKQNTSTPNETVQHANSSKATEKTEVVNQSNTSITSVDTPKHNAVDINTQQKYSTPSEEENLDADVQKQKISYSNESVKQPKASIKKSAIKMPVVMSIPVFTDNSENTTTTTKISTPTSQEVQKQEVINETSAENNQVVTELVSEEIALNEMESNQAKEVVEVTNEEMPVTAEPIETAVQEQSEEVFNEQNIGSTEAEEEVVEETTEEITTALSESEVVEQADIDKSDEVAQGENIPSPTETAGIHQATGWSIDAFAGPAFIQSNEEIILAEGDMIYQTGIDPKITTPNIGLNVKFHINNWFIQSGVGYAEYGENKNYLQNIEMHDTSGFAKQKIDDYYTYDTTGWIPDPNNSGVLIPVFDAIHHSDTSYSWVTEDSLYYEHQSIYAQNRFRYIEIPAMVGYEFRFKNVGLEVATGVSLGFRVNSSGKFLDSDNNLVDINPSNSPYTNTMMNYILTVGVKYHISNRFSVIAQPIYKTNLNSLFESGLGSDTRYSSFGVNVGMNYIIK
jgi:hypothetical protein